MAKKTMSIDWNDYCKWCGAVLPKDRYAPVRRFCSSECYWKDFNAMVSKDLIESKRNRDPCIQCGEPIPPERFVNTEYCSKKCRRRAEYLRSKERLIAERQGRRCEWCNEPIPADTIASRRYCVECARVADRANKWDMRHRGCLRLTAVRFDRMVGA